MKPGIALAAFGGENWIGGIYYVRNIAFQLAVNEKISKKYHIYIITQPELKSSFDHLPENVRVLTSAMNLPGKIIRYLMLKIYNIRYYYLNQRDLSKFGIQSIHWIPDFQHDRLSSMFSEEELAHRTAEYRAIAESEDALVLSSQNALEDFRAFYSMEKQNVAVVPFVSYIEPFIRNITKEREQQIISKFGLADKKFVCVMNQFWKHKNHKVLLQAMDLLFARDTECDLHFLFTGKLVDYRNPEYIEEIKHLLEKPELKQRVQMLGFIEREEQLIIMKHAEFVIQPSLFEGWGTVLEDAKVLDKTVLLSDIPVHREQKNENCILFDPYDATGLAALIAEEGQKDHNDNLEKGIADMYTRAREYSKGFEGILGCNE